MDQTATNTEIGRVEEPGAIAGLTDRQARFVEGILSGMDDCDALEAAGYSPASGIGSVAASEPVQNALKSARQTKIRGSLAAKALKRIEALITDDRTPAATALAASKWVLENAGHNSQAEDGQHRPVAEMSEPELEAFIRRAQSVIDQGGERPVIVITPNSGAE